MGPAGAAVQLCQEGMAAARCGRSQEALLLFQQAWELRNNKYESFLAAYHLAKHLKSATECLEWQHRAMEAADIADPRVAALYPSLCVNIGRSYAALGDRRQARKYYDLAAAHRASAQRSRENAALPEPRRTSSRTASCKTCHGQHCNGRCRY